MKDWFSWGAVLMTAGLGWVNLTGGGHDDGVKGKLTPNVRNNRGSYRSHYSHSYFYVGGK